MLVQPEKYKFTNFNLNVQCLQITFVKTLTFLQILSMVSSFGIELKELDTIDQTNCPSKGQSIVDINVNEKKNEEDEHNRLR